MLRRIMGYGSVGGLIVGGFLFTFTVAMHGEPPHGWAGMAIGYLSMLVAFSTIFLGIKRQRDVEGGGIIRFLPALAVGLGIALVASMFYVAAWELALAVLGVDPAAFIASFARSEIAAARANGASAAEVAKLAADMRAFQLDYARPSYRLPMTFAEIFPVGVLVSLVSAGLLRDSRVLPARRRG